VLLYGLEARESRDIRNIHILMSVFAKRIFSLGERPKRDMPCSSSSAPYQSTGHALRLGIHAFVCSLAYWIPDQAGNDCKKILSLRPSAVTVILAFLLFLL